MTRSGATIPFANLANTETLGTLTQLGTISASRLVSYAAAGGVGEPGQSGVPGGALRTMRFGATLPLASRSKISAV